MKKGCPVPDNVFPIGNDFGQEQILLNMNEKAIKSIYYWPEKAHAWGEEDNTEIGFIANNFYKLIKTPPAIE